MAGQKTNTKSGSNTTVIVLLLGTGFVILAIAGFMLFKQRTPPPPPLLAAPEPMEVAAPLVVALPTRPLNNPEPDAGPAEVDKGSDKGKRPNRAPKFGTIDAKEVSSFMNAHFGQVKACYERRLKTNSFLEGIVDLNIEIKPSGKVSGISVNKDTVNDAQMMTCVKKVVRGWGFPKPNGGRVIIAKTFKFQRKG